MKNEKVSSTFTREEQKKKIHLRQPPRLEGVVKNAKMNSVKKKKKEERIKMIQKK